MKTSEAKFLKSLIIALAAGAYEDEVAQQNTYCDMVGSGAWGDYDKSIPCSWRDQS